MTDSPTHTRRVLSGVQPSGDLHLGNYLGALVKFVALQDQMECLFCVVDLHALTAWQDPAKLAGQTREIAAAYIAAGVDPKKAIIFPQSAVREHVELAWIFNCVARVGWLDRMTQFKEKSGKDKEGASVGLYDYPVLQAADILVYHATHVPVGDDQRQHLELTRDIAAKFNHDFDAPGFFPLCEGLIEGAGARVMSLRDGLAKTDPAPLPETVEGLKGRPEVENLVGIYAAMTGETASEVLSRFAGKGFGVFKPALADALVARLAPISADMRRLMADPAEIDAILADGAERARAIAEPVMAETRRIVGLWPGR
jgi:tryptophanyl-tRNA synthetase